MATWVVHFRIADYFLNRFHELVPSEFVVGNVAPDCGYGKKDSYGEFNPPPSVTHWSPTGYKKDCRYKDFYNTYLKNKKHDKSYSFYLGYYVHLLTDIMWSKMIYLPTQTTYAEEYAQNPDFLKVIKTDWNDLDHKYLMEHPKFKPYEILCNKGKVDDYLPYYEPAQLTVQTKFIVDFYRKNKGKSELYRDYKYLTEEQVDNFIECADYLIELDLHKKMLVQG